MQPHRLNSAIAWLFMIGAFCFALGAVPAYVTAMGTLADALTFFVGSVFFTSASFLQLVQAQSPRMAPSAADETPCDVRFLAWLPHDRNWMAAATQFPGTLAFNVSTLFALATSLSAAQVQRAVWRPDFVGSTLFLVASGFAILALGRSPGRYSRLIAWLNMVGSVAFMVSAIASFVLPATGSAVNPRWADLGTFIGAICFLLGAALMLPAWRVAARTDTSDRAGLRRLRPCESSTGIDRFGRSA
jgi:hypothetical protein